VPIHNSQYASNWELSTARASGLVRALVDRYDISPTLLSAAGYAEFRPSSDNDTSSGRALNRRVDLVILNSQPSAPLSASASPMR
jgi:chemotaxis protein MotB